MTEYVISARIATYETNDSRRLCFDGGGAGSFVFQP